MENREKEVLFGKTLEELKEIVSSIGLPSFTAGQIADWLYKKDITEISGMSNLSKKAREALEERFELGLYSHSTVSVSADGTKKYLFPAGDKNFIETAYIPEEKRSTLCVSTQVGCKMGCLFCMTGKQGFQDNLSAGQILNQVRSLPERDKLSNLVYMGMGEPFDNIEEVMKSLEILTSEWGFAWSPRRITVSSIGIIPPMRTYIEKSDCHLAISMHSPFSDDRKKLMPVENAYPLREVLSVLKEYDLGRQRRISIEYIMFKGLNDTARHVNEMARVLNGLRIRVNLIRFHPVPGTTLEGSDDETIMKFRDGLVNKGITTTIRTSRGLDIQAACGLLSTKEMLKSKEN